MEFMMSRKMDHFAAGSLVVLAAIVGAVTAMRGAWASEESQTAISEQVKPPIQAPHLTFEPEHLGVGNTTQQCQTTGLITQLTDADIRRLISPPKDMVVVVGWISAGGANVRGGALRSMDPKRMPADIDGTMNGGGRR
jgi:hypothetical protein